MPSVASVAFTGGQLIVAVPITGRLVYLVEPPSRLAVALRGIPGLKDAGYDGGAFWAFFDSSMVERNTLVSSLAERMAGLAPGQRIATDIQQEWFVKITFHDPVTAKEVPGVSSRLRRLEESSWRWEPGRRVLLVRRKQQTGPAVKELLRQALTF